MSIKVLNEGETLAGCHFNVTWKHLESILRGESPYIPLVGKTESIVSVLPGEHGVLICVQEDHGE